MSKWITRSRRLCYEWQNRLRVFSEVVELPDGRVIDDYLQVELGDFSVIFGLTAKRRVLCQRQYKHGPRRLCLTLPAGMVEDGEDAVDAARRELLEETGFVSNVWRPLAEFVISGNQGCGRCHAFVAYNCRKVSEPTGQDLENPVLLTLTPKALKRSLLRGEFSIASHMAVAGLGLLRMGST